MTTVDAAEVAEFPIFFGFSAEQISKVLGLAHSRDYSKGEVLLEESSDSTDVYLVLNGRVGVEMKLPIANGLRGFSKRLALLRIGDIFGEMAYLEQRRRSAKVFAVDDVRVLRLEQAVLDQLFAHDHLLGYLFMRNTACILSRRLIELNFKWRDDVS